MPYRRAVEHGQCQGGISIRLCKTYQRPLKPQEVALQFILEHAENPWLPNSEEPRRGNLCRRFYHI
jgi:hypothetical protein